MSGFVARQVSERYGLNQKEVSFIGDDELDVPLLKTVGLSAAPDDAVPVVRELVDYVASAGGGRGAVREVVDLILRSKNLI